MIGEEDYIHTYIGMNVHACNYWHMDLNETIKHTHKKKYHDISHTLEKMWSHHQKFQHLIKFLLTNLITVVCFLIYHRM